MSLYKFAGAGLAAALAVSATSAAADTTKPWWPAKVVNAADGKAIVEYTPLDKASKPWNVCVMFPHMKDSFWVAVAYGVVSEATRQNVNMTLYEAGGYANLPRQLSQFDDCLASGADAIVVAAISESGLSQKFDEAKAKGIPVISTVNPVSEAPVTGKMFVDFPTMSAQTGYYLVDALNGGPAEVVTFPGPAGSGWAEAYAEGFNASLEGSKVTVVDEKYGDTGVNVQLQLVQDALQAYPEVDVIWGTAPTAEAAIGAVAEIGRSKDVMIMSTYENQAMLDAMNADRIAGFATQYPVLQGRVAIDMAVRALDKEPVMSFAMPIPEVITKATVKGINMDLVLAPAGWSPTYSVKAQP